MTAHRFRQLVAGEVASLTGAGLIGAVATFLFWLLVARRASLSLAGRATTVVVVGSVINAVSSFGLTAGVLREKVHGGLARSTLRTAYGLSAAGSVGVSALAIVVWPRDSLDVLQLSTSTLFVHLVGLSGGLALSVLTDTVAAGFGMSRLAVIRNVAVLLLRGAAVLTTNHLTCNTVLTAFWLPTVLSTAITLPILWLRADLRRHTDESPRRAVMESLRAWPTSLVFSAVSMLPPLIVTMATDLDHGAVFYLLWNTALLANSVVGAWTSLGLRENASDLRGSNFVISAMEKLVVIVVATTTAIAGIVAVIAYGPEYRHLGLFAAPLVGLGVLPYGIVQFRVLAFRRRGQHGQAMVTTATLLAVWMLGVLLTRPSSLVGVALWWCGGSALSMLVSSPRVFQRELSP